MELEEKLKAEAFELANKLEIMDKKSDDYGTILKRQETIMKMLNEETKRINSTQELTLEAKKLDLEQDKIELERQQNRSNIEIKELEMIQQKKNNAWQTALKILGPFFAGAANIGMIYLMIRANNSGETLNSFELKALRPVEFR